MSTFRWSLAFAGLAFLAAPALGQDRAVVLQVLGGGYSHTRNLNATGDMAHFKMGFNVGAALGVQVSKYVGVHGDFTFARNEGLGAMTFEGEQVNRYFFGGHLEVRYPFESGIAPFAFAGAGAVRVDQRGVEAAELFSHFTKAAGMFGAGLAYQFPNSPIELMLEGKALSYKWETTNFNRNQWDIAYSAGFAYRFRL